MMPSTAVPQRTSKKLVICCDGTWNQPEHKVDDPAYRPTNVLKLMRAVLPQDEHGWHQVVYYDPGVGTDRGLYDRFIGGAFGLGLSGHVKKAYRFIASNFQEGDELYFFGFSRGAYTVRALGGMIGAVGLLHPREIDHLPSAYQYYRTHPQQRPQSPLRATIERLCPRRVAIKFLGVWDTVGALGIPIPGLRWLSSRRVGFFNTELGSHVQYAYHALAIDERRRPFAPDLWDSVEEESNRPGHPLFCQPREVRQVWFAGVHSNVGGGYPDSGLSDIAFIWMVNRAKERGLTFDEDYLADPDKIDPNPRGTLYDSYKSVWPALRFVGIPPYFRSLGTPKNDKLKPTKGINEMIHESVLERHNSPTVNLFSVDRYQPPNLTHAQLDELPVFRERRSFRTPGQWPGLMKLAHDAEGLPCQILDVSPGFGARIHCTNPLPPGRDLIWLESSSLPLHTQEARIIWSRQDQAGLAFQV